MKFRFARKPRPPVPVRVRGRIVAVLTRQARISSTIVQVAKAPRATNPSGVRAVKGGGHHVIKP